MKWKFPASTRLSPNQRSGRESSPGRTGNLWTGRARRMASQLIAIATLAATSLVAIPALAQAPDPTSTPPAPTAPNGVPTRPSQPPDEAINCVRPATHVRPELDATDSLEVALNDSTREVLLSISEIPESATCSSVFRTPSESNPV
jgi:hypothetical protein